MTKWIILTVAVISGLIMLFMIQTLNNGERPPVSSVAPVRTITVYDAFRDGIHRFTGELKLPHSCYILNGSARIDEKSPQKAILQLVSTNKEADWTNCLIVSTRYQFDLLMDGPQDITAKLFLDDTELPIILIQKEWNAAKGTYIAPMN